MRSAFEISANQVMDENPVTVEASDSVGSAKNTMEQNQLRAVPVVNSDGSLEGAIGFRDLVRFIQFNPDTVKLSKVMHQPPEFDPGDNLVELCDLRINSGKKMLVTTEAGKLEGVVGDQEFLVALQEVEELENFSTRNIETRDLINAYENDPIDRARHAMLDNNVSRLPVLDSDGNLTGKIDSLDILKMMIPRDRQPSGGTSGGRSEGEMSISGGTEKIELSGVTVDQLMDRTPTFSEERLDSLDAIDMMIENDSDDIVFVSDRYPEAIVTVKDFVQHLSEMAPGKTVFVQITGLEMDEEKAAVQRKIRKQVQGSLGRKLERPEELSLRVKKAEKDGKKHRWSLNLRLVSEYGVTTVEVEDWELLDAVDQALGKMNEVIRRKHEKESEHRS